MSDWPFARLHKAVSYAIAILGLVALSLGSNIGPAAAVLVGALVVLSIFAEGALLEHPIYQRSWNAIVVFALAVQIVRGAGGGNIVQLASEFAALLQLSRLFLRRRAKEHQQIQALAFLHLIAATILSTGIAYAAVFFGFVLLLPWMFALTHLRNEVEARYVDDPDAPLPEVGREALNAKGLVGPWFLVATAALAVPLFAVTAAFFLLFPRVGLGMLSFGQVPGQSVAGFGSDVQLGGFGHIRSDPSVVLRIAPEELAPDATPPLRTFRLRGTSFDHYERGRWRRSTDDPPLRVRREFNYLPVRRVPDPLDAELERWSLILEPIEESVVFLPEGTLALRVEGRVENAIDTPRVVHRRRGLDFRYEADGLELRYVAVTSPDEAGRFAEALSDAERERYLALPEPSERLRALVQRVAGDGSDAEKTTRILRFLRDGDYAYTLDQPDVGDADPLEVFLFEARRGHCEYFATAFAVMARVAGMPSRNVVGFLGGSWNEYGRYFAIRQGDAHSWAEVYFGGAWHTVDPTPPSREAMAPELGVFGELRDLYDALRMRWARDVVGYDLNRQVSALRAIGQFFRGLRQDDEPEQASAEGDAESEELSPMLLALLLPLFGAAGFWWWRRRPRGQPVPPELRLYQKMEARLARRGHRRAPGCTPARFLAQLQDAEVPGIETIAAITALHEAARFGAQESSPKELQRLELALRRL